MKAILFRTLTVTDTDVEPTAAEEEQICPYCGEPYSGALGAIGAAIHGVIWLLCKIFGLGNPFEK